jgi:hypothetical protein
MSDPFLTVHDFNLTIPEVAIWGGVGHTPETYPINLGMQPQDAALCHIVLLLLERRDYETAVSYAEMIQDKMIRALIRTIIDGHLKKW